MPVGFEFGSAVMFCLLCFVDEYHILIPQLLRLAYGI